MNKQNNLNIVLFAITSVVVGIVIFNLVNHRIEVHHADDPIVGAIIEMQQPLLVSKINVLKGDEFDLTLQDNRRIHGVLDLKATPEARLKVTEFLSSCKNPRVLLKKKHNDVWLVHIYVTTTDTDGRNIEINLSKWLLQKRLAYH